MRKPAFRKVFRRLFGEVAGQCIAKGLASGRLVAYEEEGLEALKKRTGHRREKRVSRADPEAGHMKHPGKPEGQDYLYLCPNGKALKPTALHRVY